MPANIFFESFFLLPAWAYIVALWMLFLLAVFAVPLWLAAVVLTPSSNPTIVTAENED